MIYPKKAQYKKYEGENIATIYNVESEPNQYYDEKNQNSTEEVLSITFEVEESGNEPTIYTQRFIAPLLGDKTLFGMIVSACGMKVEEGKEFDEQELIGKKISLVWGENKKGFNTIIGVSATTQDQTTTETEDPGLPWEDET